MPRVLVYQPTPSGVSETFLRSISDGIQFPTTVACGVPPEIEGRSVLSVSAKTAMGGVHAWLRGVRPNQGLVDWATRISFAELLRQARPAAVLAHYGHAATWIMEACHQRNVPLIAHFHGFDAVRHDIVRDYADRFRQLFDQASAIICVSDKMASQLRQLGASPERLCKIRYGVDLDQFCPVERPSRLETTFLGVGRFVEKKGPHLTLLAFAECFRRCPAARLRMIGGGPLLGVCEDLLSALGIESAVDLLGPCGPESVREEMQRADVFVQHSMIASDGDCEGSPVAISEAVASGLPVISTVHAGIPELVEHDRSGILVQEREVSAMSHAMLRLAEDPVQRMSMGIAARQIAMQKLNRASQMQSINDLLTQCISGEVLSFSTNEIARSKSPQGTPPNCTEG